MGKNDYRGFDMEKTGENIEHLIKEKNLTFIEVAEHMNVTVQAVYKWRKGKCLPGWDMVDQLCKLLGTTFDGLIVRKEDGEGT